MPDIPPVILGLQRRGRQIGSHALLLGLVIAVGIFARTWEFRRLPPGLNADEASIGVEAYDLAHFGVDRNGVSYPVQFIAWGSGQNALYGYVLVPFVAILGLSPIVVRLPMLLAGIASLPLIYLVGTMTFNRQVGLLGAFLLAISPWHILLSRWGLESNFLPFVFLLAYACLLLGLKRRAWLFAACLLFGISLYAYGTAYAVVPVFIICAFVIMTRRTLVRPRDIAIGALLFSAVAAPIGLFLAINSLQLPSIALGPITIPRLPVEPRFETASLLGQANPTDSISNNLWAGLRLLLAESDGIIYNVVDPYGTSYHLGLPLAVAGLAVLMAEAKPTARVEFSVACELARFGALAGIPGASQHQSLQHCVCAVAAPGSVRNRLAGEPFPLRAVGHRSTAAWGVCRVYNQLPWTCVSTADQPEISCRLAVCASFCRSQRQWTAVRHGRYQHALHIWPVLRTRESGGLLEEREIRR